MMTDLGRRGAPVPASGVVGTWNGKLNAPLVASSKSTASGAQNKDARVIQITLKQHLWRKEDHAWTVSCF